MTARPTGLWITDDEMRQRLGLDDVDGRAAIQELDRQGVLPQKWPLFGNKRWWPAVLNFFLTRYGGLPGASEATTAATWEESFDHVQPKRTNHTRSSASIARLQRNNGPTSLEGQQG